MKDPLHLPATPWHSPRDLIRRQEGVVMIAVLWICALVMWFTMQIGAEVRLRGEEQVQIFRRSQALYLAIGGCYEALARMGEMSTTGLLDKASDTTWQPDGTPHRVEYLTGEALVSVESETNKININQARPEQLREVLLQAGVAEHAVDELADVIGDFIDRDDMPRLHGGEADVYQRLGLPYGPFNGPLLSLDQLLLIPGISPALLYGHFQKADRTDDGGSDAGPASTVPAKDSLFQMLSVYGKNTSLMQKEFQQELQERRITWETGGTYRIYSTGKAFAGATAVTICLIVRYTPNTKAGYEVLYRKTL
jgi:hypothetical protein